MSKRKKILELLSMMFVYLFPMFFCIQITGATTWNVEDTLPTVGDVAVPDEEGWVVCYNEDGSYYWYNTISYAR